MTVDLGGNVEPAAESFRLAACTARELCDLPDPPETDMLLGPLIVSGSRTIIVGDTGHGKTTLALQLATAVLTGGDALGYRGAGAGPLLIVDLEQGLRSVKRVLREAGLADRDDVIYVRAPDGLALDSEAEHREELERVIAEHSPAVLSIDPYYKAHRGDANEERAVVDLMRFLDSLRSRYGFALLLPAHPRKDQNSNGARKLTLHDVAGSGAAVRGAELVLALERLSHGAARLRILKDRDGDLPVGETWALLFDRTQGFRRDPRGEGERPTKAPANEIAEWIIGRGGSATPAAIKEHFDIGDSTLRNRREGLAKLGIDYLGGQAGRDATYAVRDHEQTALDDESNRDGKPRWQTAPARIEANADQEPRRQAETETEPRQTAIHPARTNESADLQDKHSNRETAPPKGGSPPTADGATPEPGRGAPLDRR